MSSQLINAVSLVDFEYDRDGLLVRAGTMTIGRNAQHGALASTTLSELASTWTYSGFGELAAQNTSFGGQGVYDIQYSRDGVGRVTQRVETVEGVTITIDYGYDAAGRLTEVRRDGVVTAYAYDSNGNQTSFTGSAGTISGTYDEQDRLIAYGAASYTYTPNGDLREKMVGSDVTRYEYDAIGNLLGVSLPDGTAVDYVIDGQNRRVGVSVDGVMVRKFIYNGVQLVAELDASDQVISHFVYGTRQHVPDYMVRGGEVFQLVHDEQGSVRLVVNAQNGAVAQRLDYDAFGRVTLNSNPDFQPFAFAGGLFDGQTGLVRFGARDYDPETGRFTTKDPTLFGGDNTNLYAYALGDPVNLRDPGGRRVIVNHVFNNPLVLENLQLP